MPKQPSTVQATETEYPPAPPAVETLYRDLESEIRRQRPDEDLGPLEKAFRFAAYHHGNQTRRSGEPYMVHPIEVTRILTEINMDMPGLQTALLHDVVEDTGVKLEEIRKAFGGQVALIVDGVTKLSKLEAYNAEERQAESYRKMLLAMTTDLRVILVKLADRLHNMRTLQNLPPEKQERIARETLEIYAPIAHRLGMGKVRGELEDLAFRFLEPEASADLMREVESRRHEIEAVLTLVQRTVEEKLRQEGIPARVSGRVKRLYSIYQKMKRQKIGLDQIYDLLALRIITDSVLNCYAALGVIHKEWTPIPGRIKDFIAIPRPNLYRSLHTSVIGPGGHAFEVQIRTEEMHRIAEEGIAAQIKEERLRQVGRRWWFALGKEHPLRCLLATGDIGAAPTLLAGFGQPHLIVGDLPYGIQHAGELEALLREGLPVWAGLLEPGGAMALAWDATRFPRERMLAQVANCTALLALNDPPYDALAHRVDRVIKRRDILVARRTS